MSNIKYVPEGYTVIGFDGDSRYLCLPDKDAEAKNRMSEQAVIVNTQTGKVSKPMMLQLAFKWAVWEEYSEKEK